MTSDYEKSYSSQISKEIILFLEFYLSFKKKFPFMVSKIPLNTANKR